MKEMQLDEIVGGNQVFLRLEAGSLVTLRFIPPILGYVKHFEPCVTTEHEDDALGVVCPLKASGLKGSQKYSSWVFVREQSNSLQVLDFGATIVNALKDQKKRSGKDPLHAMVGVDFKVSVTGTGQSTKYGVVPLGETPLTAAELAEIEKLGGTSGLLKKLTDYRKPMPVEDILKEMAKKGMSDKVTAYLNYRKGLIK